MNNDQSPNHRPLSPQYPQMHAPGYQHLSSPQHHQVYTMPLQASPSQAVISDISATDEKENMYDLIIKATICLFIWISTLTLYLLSGFCFGMAISIAIDDPSNAIYSILLFMGGVVGYFLARWTYVIGRKVGRRN